MIHDGRLFHGQVRFRPREIRKQLTDLFMCAQFTGNESASSQRKRNR